MKDNIWPLGANWRSLTSYPCKVSLDPGCWGPFSMCLCPNPASCKGLAVIQTVSSVHAVTHKSASIARWDCSPSWLGDPFQHHFQVFRYCRNLLSFLLYLVDNEKNCGLCSLGLGPFFPPHWLWRSQIMVVKLLHQREESVLGFTFRSRELGPNEFTCVPNGSFF